MSLSPVYRLSRSGHSDAVLRPLVAADAAALYAAVIRSHAALARWFPWCHAGYGPADASSRAAQCQAAWAAGTEFPFGLFDAECGELLGCVGLSQINRLHRSANLGYWIGAAHQGQGLAARAAALVATFGFRTLGLVRIEIVVAPENAASLRVAEKLGATREALARNRVVVHDRAIDAWVFSLVPGDAVLRSGDGGRP